MAFDLSRLIYITMAVLVFIAFIQIPSGNGLVRLLNSSNEFSRIAKSVIGNAEQGNQFKKDLLDETDASAVFRNKTLRYQLRLYESDVESISINGAGECFGDIGDYFNYELLDQISNNSLIEHISSALTALGILGTFLGLAFGLKGFDLSSSSSILDGIARLIEGLQYAFWTSIVGIILSLFLGTFSKAVRGIAERNLDLFIDNFHSYVLDTGMVSSINRIERSLKKLDSIDSRFTDTINEPLVKIQEIVDTFSDSVKTQQRETLQEMSDVFIERIDDKLGEKVENLAIQLDGIKSENEAVMLSYKELQLQVDALTQQLSESRTDTITAVKQYQDSTILLGQEYKKQNVKVLAAYKSAATKLGNAVDTTVDAYNGAADAIRESYTAFEQGALTLHELVEADNNTIQKMQEVTESIAEYSLKIDDAIISVEIQSQLIGENAENSVKTISEYGKGVIAASQEFVEFIKEQEKSFQKNTENVLLAGQAGLEDQLKVMMLRSSDFTSYLNDMMKKITQTSEDSVKVGQDALLIQLKTMTACASDYTEFLKKRQERHESVSNESLAVLRDSIANQEEINKKFAEDMTETISKVDTYMGNMEKLPEIIDERYKEISQLYSDGLSENVRNYQDLMKESEEKRQERDDEVLESIKSIGDGTEQFLSNTKDILIEMKKQTVEGYSKIQSQIHDNDETITTSANQVLQSSIKTQELLTSLIETIQKQNSVYLESQKMVVELLERLSLKENGRTD